MEFKHVKRRNTNDHKNVFYPNPFYSFELIHKMYPVIFV